MNKSSKIQSTSYYLNQLKFDINLKNVQNQKRGQKWKKNLLENQLKHRGLHNEVREV